MAVHSYVVKVPKPDPKSYDPNRPMTSLVRNQVFHLSLAERHLPKKHRTGTDAYSIKTEAEAGKYIERLTSRLHPLGRRKPKSSNKREPK